MEKLKNGLLSTPTSADQYSSIERKTDLPLSADGLY